MKKKPVAILDTAGLRRQAEAKWNVRRQKTPVPPVTEVEALRLVHELEVHQIELELQNEELLSSRADLEAALEQYDDLYDFAPVGYFTLTNTGAIQRVNLTGARLLGLERSTLLKRRFGLLVDFEQRPVFSTFLFQVFATSGEHATCEVLLDRAGAAPLWVQLEAVSSAGEPACKVIVMDITARKQAEEKLLNAEAFLSRMIEQSSFPMWIADERGTLLRLNQACCNFLQLTPDEVVGRYNIFRDNLVVEQGFLPQVKGVFERGETAHFEISYDSARVEGLALQHTVNVTLEVLIFPIMDSAGRITNAVIQHNDITARKRAEQELQVALAKYKTLFESFPLGITVSDAAGSIVETNLTAEKLLHIPQAEHNQRNIAGPEWKIIRPDGTPMPPAEYASVRALAEKRIVGNVEMGIVGSEATTWISVTAAPLPLPGYGVVVTYGDITQRKIAENALRASEEKFRQAFIVSPDSININRLQDGRYVSINQGFTQIMGYTEAEVLGKTSFELNVWDDPADRQRLTEGLKQTGMVENLEARFRAKDGSLRLGLMSASLLEIEGVPHIISITRDITKRKQAEEALRASEEKYRGLMESLDSIVATVDYDGKFLYMNDMAAEQLGGSAALLTGRTMLELFPEPHASRQIENIRAVIKEDQGRVFETISIVQGQPRWYRTSIQPIHAENGQVTHVLLNSHDINDLKVAQQELQELNRTLEIRVQQRTAEVQDLYDNAPAGYHSLDVDGKLLMINQTELNWLGYTREEVLGRPFTDFYAPSSLAVFNEQFPAFKKRGWVKDLEVELVSKDQRVIPVVINSTAIYDANGNFVMSRSTLLDDSERKAANETLRRTNLKLEHALRMKDEFLANMSHELRTPLTGILGASEILLDGYRGTLNEAQRKFVHNIELGGRHLLSLINDLLDVSKIEAGKLELQLEPVSISDLCQASLAFVKEQALKKNIALEFLPETALPTLLADQRRLKQILINLLSNAVKFTPAIGQVILKVTANPAQKRLEFAVSDTGIGISAADLQRLFTPFTQVDGSLARQYEGTGLGLALVKRLTELHGGTVTVTSVVGQGSCFTVFLPWEPVPEVQQASVASEAKIPAKSWNIASPGTATILLAEDNETNRMLIGDFLESLGYQMLAASNGLEALNLAAEIQPDLIVMDIQMPGMDGLEAIRHLRADPRFTDTPIVALTALAMPGDRERCLAAGANGYISKPISLKELADMVKVLNPLSEQR